jgi:hypothetical protein
LVDGDRDAVVEPADVASAQVLDLGDAPSDHRDASAFLDERAARCRAGI